MTEQAAMTGQLEVLLDDYGPLAPTVLPWLARWATGAALPDVARAAAEQAKLATARRWSAVPDAVAEVIAGRVSEPDVRGPELAGILPSTAAYLTDDHLMDMLRHGLKADATCYAELTHPDLDVLWPSRPTDQWQLILAAARTRPVPPLANLPLLTRLVAGQPVRPDSLPGWEAAYLLPHLRGLPLRADVAEAALAEAEDYVADETCWYAAAIYARIAPQLDEDQRARMTVSASAAPPAWRSLLRELAGRYESWQSPAAELAAVHPAFPRLDEIARRADRAELSAACAVVAHRIDREFGGPGRPGPEATEPPVRDERAVRILRPGNDVPDRALLSRGEPSVVRYLVGQYPTTVAVNEPFNILVRMTTNAVGGAPLNPFPVPADVVLIADPHPGLRLLGHHRFMLHVPREGEPEPRTFEFQADSPGAQRVDVVAFLDGTYLGALAVEVTAEHKPRPDVPDGSVSAQIDLNRVDGAVTLMVRYEPADNLYRFAFIDENNEDEVPHQLSYEPGPQVERLIAELDDFAKGRAGYPSSEALAALAMNGKALWRDLLPKDLREQFWQRNDRIKQLTIVAKNDTVPWELLYPRDRGRDAGKFLVQQFPVTRAIFSHHRARQLSLRPIRFVLPSRPPPEAQAEVAAARAALESRQLPGDSDIVRTRSQLLDLINGGDFGVLHFACHNNFDPLDGASITFDDGRFRPVDLEDARSDRTLERSAPVVFINACRSAGSAARYSQLESWAQAFLEAGAAVFIGSLWAVEDSKARTFATQFYKDLQRGESLGEAVMAARAATAGGNGDPTWLAYSVYGNAVARRADR